jgi:Spy/CpxP family protein refolding chaperone
MFLNHKVFLFLLITGLTLVRATSMALAQEPPPQAGPDLVEQLKLTPEQRQRIRAYRDETKAERAAVSQRLRESNIALEQALDSDNLDETLIEQRIREVNAAQAAQLRLRIQNEMQIRRLLTPDQLATWRLLRQQTRNILRDLPQRRRQGAMPPQRNLPPRRQ